MKTIVAVAMRCSLKLATVMTALGCCFLSSAKGDLIDLTPGGFSILNPPNIYVQWVNGQLGSTNGIAYATPTGWAPGFLEPPLFTGSLDGSPNATINWNLGGSPYSVGFVFVGIGPAPTAWINMYEVTGLNTTLSSGLFTINGVYPITGIGIYGPVPLQTPDTGNALALFGLGVVALCFFGSRWCVGRANG